MDVNWLNPPFLILAPVLLLLVGLAGWAFESRKQKLSRLFSSADNFRFSAPSPVLRRVRWAFFAVAAALFCLALAEPRYGIEMRSVVHKGRDIVFLLDVSKSMLAKDIAPSRLERAKADILDALPSMTGHRIALIAFAGRSKEVCPLTFDHGHFSERLKKLEPGDVSLGGTDIGIALSAALATVNKGARIGNQKDFILVTDGHDLSGYYQEAAGKAGEMKVTVYTVGIGLSDEVPIQLPGGEYQRYEGEIVKTALNADPLREIATLSGDGFYQNLAASPDWLSNILRDINRKEQGELQEDKRERMIPRYRIPLAFALFFWCLSVLLPDRVPGRETK